MMTKSFRNPRRSDWEYYGKLTADILSSEKDSLDSTNELDESLRNLTRTQNNIYEPSCKAKHSRRLKKPRRK